MCELPRDVEQMKSLLQTTKVHIDRAAHWSIISAATALIAALILLLCSIKSQLFFGAAAILIIYMATVSIVYMLKISRQQDEEYKTIEFVDISSISKDKVLDTVIRTLNPSVSQSDNHDSLYANVANCHKASIIWNKKKTRY